MSITGPDTFEGAVFRSIDSATRGRRVYDTSSIHKETTMARRKTPVGGLTPSGYRVKKGPKGVYYSKPTGTRKRRSRR